MIPIKRKHMTFWCLIFLLPILAGAMVLIGCGKAGEMQDAAPPEEEIEATVPEPALQAEPDGPDRIFFDNSQAMFGLTETDQYGGVLHALMQSEALRDTECYTLQTVADKASDNLRWSVIDYNALKVSFTEKNLYTFYQLGEPIPKLGEKGPLGLLFDSGLIDPARLTLVVTDMTENNFGASQIAAELSEILAARDDTGLTMYGLTCSGFSGNVSYPAFTAKGTEIRTVLGYRGNAQAYILAIGPIAELIDFDARFAEKLGGNAALDKAIYWGGDNYWGESGIGDFAVIEARKLSGGRADTLNTTVNAVLTEQTGDTFRFEYSKSTASKYKNNVQLTLLAPMSESSPFRSEALTVSDLTVEQRSLGREEGAFAPSDAAVELTACALEEALPLWKEGAEKRDGSRASESGGWLLQLGLEAPGKKTEYKISFDLTAEADPGSGWIAEKSATVYEYQSLQDLLPVSPLNDRHQIWTAGATDILSRTLDLTDVDQLLSAAVPQTRIVRHIEIILTR
ncbi:MAG: hypothetical protein IJO51_00070 [Clostridia bacterium]|nr:hypothetical protein [Clostridia bacterium]